MMELPDRTLFRSMTGRRQKNAAADERPPRSLVDPTLEHEFGFKDQHVYGGEQQRVPRSEKRSHNGGADRHTEPDFSFRDENKELPTDNESHADTLFEKGGGLVRAVAASHQSNDERADGSTLGMALNSYSVLGYQSQEEMDNRHHRFPSVDERVKLYMTNWYLPPCAHKHVDKISDADAYVEFNHVRNATTNADMLLVRESRTWREKIRGPLYHYLIPESTDYNTLHFMMNREVIANCHNSYCTDLARYLFPAMDRAPPDASPVPILYQFSDAEKTRAYILEKHKYGGYPNIPHLKKFRFALSKEERDRVVGTHQECSIVPRRIPRTLMQEQQEREDPNVKLIPVAQPIVFKLTVDRHFGSIPDIPSKDRSWSEKKDQAIFRGQFTGHFPNSMSGSDIDKLSAREQCQLLQRCRLVYSSASSGTLTAPLVDAKLALPIIEVRKYFPHSIDGIELYGKRVSIADMLEYKAIIMLEGNDVSSGLKWALYSNSVVMTQRPTLTSWAMEELLEPWVHYVPLADDLSDVHEKMQWILDHDEEAQEIAHRSKLWIADLVLHPDAAHDEEVIFDEILRRYRAHFRHQPTMRLEDAANVQ